MRLDNTLMYQEIREIPDAVSNVLGAGREAIMNAAEELRNANPSCMITIARGSSDHAATYFKYACELMMGIPVASVGPSVSSIYNAELKLKNTACVAISQSGKSPDIVSMAKSATSHGSISLAITNNAASDLASVCSHTLDIHAGAEHSVAATKTFVTSIVASLALLAFWKKDQALIAALDALPASLEKATHYEWRNLCNYMEDHESLYVLGRGLSYAIAQEAALKFKETCQIHAEAYSSAEVLHGPVSIIKSGYPVLALAARDAAEDAVVSTAEQLAEKGASLFVTSDRARLAKTLGFADTIHPLTDPLALVVSFYCFIERLAASKGLNPDTPRNLSKVTETV